MVKLKEVYFGYRIAFNGAGLWIFGNDFARNFKMFCVSLSTHCNNHKSNFLFLKVQHDVNGSFGSLEKKSSTNFSKANAEFCLSLHYNHDNSYFFVHGKLICKFNAGNKNVNFPTQFHLGSLSNKFRAIDSREVSFKENVYDFSVDNNDIDKSNILSIRKYLLTKNNVK